MSNAVVLATQIEGLPRIGQGKVRDIYAVGETELLLVATDRISAFDVVLGEGIPDKGRVLTRLSVFWFDTAKSVVPNHFLTADDEAIASRLGDVGVCVTPDLRVLLRGRALLCRRAAPLAVEAVVRGYLSGSGWAAYKAAEQGAPASPVNLWGHALPPGLTESARLPEPLFTPSTKATQGHDMPLTPDETREILGAETARAVEQAAVALYSFAAEKASERGIIIADTKFEFGKTEDGSLLLIDEALTADSSRFWEAAVYAPGQAQPSFDKQFVRDYLLSVPGWNKQAPAPPLPPEVVEQTAEKYREALRRLTGQEWSE